MPQKLSTTFSSGQVQTNEVKLRTDLMADDKPVFEYLPKVKIGANQISPSLDNTFSGATFDTFCDNFSEVQSPQALSSSQNVQNSIVPSGAILSPRPEFGISGRSPKLITKQLWLGTVTDISGNGFSAILRDKTNPRNPDEQGSFEFDNTEISPEDLALVSPGSDFYWIIGVEESFARNRQNVSRLQFRRLPAWTQRKLDRATEQARLLQESFLRDEA